MSNNNPFGGGGMFPSMMLPMLMPQAPARQEVRPDNLIPARVSVAIDFLAFLANKRHRTAVTGESNVGGVQMEVIDQDALCPEEETTRDSALQLLAKYFDDGKFVPNEIERIQIDGVKKQLDHREYEGRLMTCPVCTATGPRDTCQFCQGTGKILVQPIGD